MPPKKAKVSKEVVLSSSIGIDKAEDVGLDVNEKTKPGKEAVSRKVPSNPPTMVMVKEALKELDTKKGVSSQAIRSYIKQKYPSVDLVRLKYMLRNALTKGIESGVLVRPANSTVTTGTQGKFRIAVRVKAKETKLKNVENKDPNVKVPKAAKPVVKLPRGTEKGTEKVNKRLKEKGPQDLKTKVPGGATDSKVVPAKKPKAKKSEAEAADSQLKPKTKITKAAKSEAAESKGSKPSKKPAGNKADKALPTKAPRKRATKAVE